MTVTSPKFAIGDAVTFMNDYGVIFPGKTVQAFDDSNFGRDHGPRYFITPTDAHWFSVHETTLIPAGDAPWSNVSTRDAAYWLTSGDGHIQSVAGINRQAVSEEDMAELLQRYCENIWDGGVIPGGEPVANVDWLGIARKLWTKVGGRG